MDKPKPCPWCGWRGDRIGVYPGDTFRWMVPSCPACGATPGDVRVEEYVKEGTPLSDAPENYAAALEAWNKRVEPPKD